MLLRLEVACMNTGATRNQVDSREKRKNHNQVKESPTLTKAHVRRPA